MDMEQNDKRQQLTRQWLENRLAGVNCMNAQRPDRFNDGMAAAYAYIIDYFFADEEAAPQPAPSGMDGRIAGALAKDVNIEFLRKEAEDFGFSQMVATLLFGILHYGLGAERFADVAVNRRDTLKQMKGIGPKGLRLLDAVMEDLQIWYGIDVARYGYTARLAGRTAYGNHLFLAEKE